MLRTLAQRCRQCQLVIFFYQQNKGVKLWVKRKWLEEVLLSLNEWRFQGVLGSFSS
jgi:hypothetical protein